jgi:glycogen debranching enzyme
VTPFQKSVFVTEFIHVSDILLYLSRDDCFEDESRLHRCGERFKSHLEELNKEMFDEIQNHLLAAVENCIAGMRYFRVQHDGPHIKEVSAKNPLTPR